MCDTFIILPAATLDGSIIFAKNSDREPNEAQSLEYHPPQTHAKGAALKCTYIEIPQARETLGVLLSRPYWMWGAEMGANEKGVVIGNEAVWSRMPADKKGRLIGMDLLRLALERSATAAGALATIIQLLNDHGQGGICGYEDKRMAYHNSFIIADPLSAWVLETAGHLWIAQKIRKFYAISNGLTIAEEFDEIHPDLIETARKKGWLKKGATFDFARCFADWFYTTFSASKRRRSRVLNLLQACARGVAVEDAIKILRDHHQIAYLPDSHFFCDRLCAHAANPLSRHSGQTTGSLVAHLQGDRKNYWATGTSAPCLGIFKPIWLEKEVLPDIGPASTGRFDPQTLWWRHERLHRSVLLDFTARRRVLLKERDQMESDFRQQAREVSADGRQDLTRRAFALSHSATQRWTVKVQDMPVKLRGNFIYRRYWQRQNQKAGLI